MTHANYLTKQLQQILTTMPGKINRSYKNAYNVMRTKRFLIQTLIIFIFQFLIIINLNFSYPPPPLYPPMGVAFVIFYLMGSQGFIGLFLAGLLAYVLKGLPSITVLFYLTADLLPAYLGAALSVKILSYDVHPFANYKDSFAFIKLTAFMICVFSAGLRIVPFLLSQGIEFFHNSIFLKRTFFNLLDLWLADLNAVLIFSVFLLSWVTLPFSRSKLSPYSLSPLIMIAGFFILLSIIGTRYISFFWIIFLFMIVTLILSLIYGYLIATAALFMVSCIYVSYFQLHLQFFILHFGLGFYSLIPTLLLIFTLLVIYCGHRSIDTSSRSSSA